ncbi:MAG: ATP-binding protein [Nitrospinae bacterium]|nr:ATP-binding protein [Nitrospinota bacterium]
MKIIIATDDACVGKFLDEFKKDVITPFYPDDPDNFLKDATEQAILEALLNAQEHGNGNATAKKITIEWFVISSHLVVSVADEGAGFTPAIPTGPPPRGSRRGRGLLIISTTPNAIFNFNEKGNKITLIFNKTNFSRTKP